MHQLAFNWKQNSGQNVIYYMKNLVVRGNPSSNNIQSNICSN